MNLELNDTVLVVQNFSDNKVREAVVTKVTPEFVRVNNDNEPINAAYCFPMECKAELLQILTKRKELLQAYEDSMQLIYQLRNKY